MASIASQVTESEPVELTDDVSFARRITRLAITSSIALGLVWLFATGTLDLPPGVGLSLALGWLLMPSILLFSLRRPRVRYALVIPSALVAIPLLMICMDKLPAEPVGRAGWLLLTAGILSGGVLGVWFWFRWMPVPASLHDPFSRGRWALVGVHVALVVSGLILVAVSAL